MALLEFRNGFFDYSRMTCAGKLAIYLDDARSCSYAEYDHNKKRKLFDTKHYKPITIKLSMDSLATMALFNFDTNEFEGTRISLESIMLKHIISPIISSFFNEKKFLNKFYKTYISNYYDKMATTVRNYVVNSINFDSVIPPIENGWFKFIRTQQALEIIDELTVEVIYALEKQSIIFEGDADFNNRMVKCTMYDLLMRPNTTTKKMCDTFKLSSSQYELEDRISTDHCELFDGYNYQDLNKFDRYSSYLVFSDVQCVDELEMSIYSTPIDYIKSIVRYVFVNQFKEAIPYFIYNKRKSNSSVESIIADIDLFYTRNLTTIRSNTLYYKSLLDMCASVIAYGDEDVARSSSRDILSALTSKAFVNAIAKTDKEKFNKFINMRDPANGKFPCEAYKLFKELVYPLYNASHDALENSYNFSFISRWNEIIKENKTWIPADYIKNIKGFLRR